MVELGFQRSIRILHHLEVRHVQNKKYVAALKAKSRAA
jgi:hypothetical protein